jgi:hypothetical protein
MTGFNPQGGEEAEIGTRGQGGIDFKAVFTGIVDATPVMFNPTKQQLIQIKDVPQERQQYVFETKYVDAYERDGKKQSRLDLLMKINPNDLLAEKDEEGNVIKKKYVDDYYFNVSITISDEDELSKGGEGKTQKYRFINESLQSTWAENLDVIKSNPKMDWFKTDTARIAKRGEVMLYNLLYAMYKFAGTKENPITGFKLGDDPTETFCDIVRGDVSALNDLIDPDSGAFKYFAHEDNTVRKVAVMLGVRESEKLDNDGNPYYNQAVYTNAYVNNCFAKEGRMLPKDAIASINGDGFKASTQGSLKFQQYDPLKAAQQTIDALANVDETTVDDTVMEDFGSEDYSAAFGDADFA